MNGSKRFRVSSGWAIAALVAYVVFAAIVPWPDWMAGISNLVYVGGLLYVGYRYLRGDRLRWHNSSEVYR